MALPDVIIVSSHVAASAVGGGAQSLYLARRGLEAALVPTVLFGRHPGLGPPGGGAVETRVLEGVLAGVEAAGAFSSAKAAILGYFNNADQIAVVQAAMRRLRAVNPGLWIVLDPIMGDEDSGQYVSDAVAEGHIHALAPLADLIACNAWELARLTGRPVRDLASAKAAMGELACQALVSSVPLDEAMGVIWSGPEGGWLASHARAPRAPRGTGDRLTAGFVAETLQGAAPRTALQASVADVAAWATGSPVCVNLEPL
jgi:pyridoxine kinase